MGGGRPARELEAETPNRSDLLFLERLLRRHLEAGHFTREERVRLYSLLPRLSSLDKPADAAALTDGQILKEAERRLERAVDKDDGPALRKRLAAFYLFADAPDKSLETLREMPPVEADEKDLILPMLMARTYLGLGDYAKTSVFLDRVARRIQSRVPLQVSTPILCTGVRGFRLYTPREGGALLPAEDVYLYAELAGVTFRRDPKGDEARFSLHIGLSLRNDFQQEVWSEPDHGDLSESFRGPLRDMHIVVGFRVPHTLTPGRYHLILTCTDKFSGKTGTGDLAFDVGKR